MNIKKFLFPSLLVCGLALTVRLSRSALAKPASDDASYDALDAYVQQQMRRLSIPGAYLAIVKGDEVVHLRGFGHARPGGKEPTPQTPFVLGSTTKSFTALAVMQLVEAGKVELDAPVQRYLPWFRVADPRASAEMTVRHLLYQTSGLPTLPGLTALADLDASPDAAERQARALSTLKLTRAVGEAFEYSNLNYNLLGLIIESASGETYADYIQNHIFKPLEMCHSYTAQAEAQKNGLAIGHRYWFAISVPARNLPMPRGSLASGQLISCAEDMARYLIAHLNGGRYDDAQILSPAGIAELHRGVADFNEMGVSVGKYAMGWICTEIGKKEIVWHGGNVPDFSSFIGLAPEQRKGVVLLLNADHYGLPPVLAEVGLNVTAMLAEEQPAPIRLGFIPWAMRALLFIPLLQMIGVAATARQFQNWRDGSAHRQSPRMSLFYFLLSLIPNVSLAALSLFLWSKGLLRYFKLFNPDMYWIALVCGSLAGMWTFLRTVLMLRIVRKR
jgi:CubicO group peptidase (beta-lactamase class C family)